MCLGMREGALGPVTLPGVKPLLCGLKKGVVVLN